MQHTVNSKSIKSKQPIKSTSKYLHLIFFTTDKSVISFMWVFTKFSVPYWFSQCETNHKRSSIKAWLTVMIHMFWNLLIFHRHSTQEPASDQLLVMMNEETFLFHGNLHEKAVLTVSATLSEVLLLFFTGGSKPWFHELPVSTKVAAICDNQSHNRKRGCHHTVPHKGPREIY